MGLSTLSYPYTGGAQTFNAAFSMGYLNKDTVRVYVVGELDGTGAQVYRAFTWETNNTVIRVTDPLVANVDTVVLERTVDKQLVAVDFENGGDVTPRNLMLNAKHVMMIYHELLDGRIGDADINALAATATASQTAAAASELAAATSATAAAASEAAASTSATAASTSATATSADAASTAADRVATATDAASTAADAVATAADAVATAADSATTAAKAAATTADAAATAADRVATAADVVSTSADAAAAAASAASVDTATLLARANHTGTQSMATVSGLSDGAGLILPAVLPAATEAAQGAALQATYTDAVTGTQNTKYMTPLRAAQAITSLTPPGIGVGQSWSSPARSNNVVYQNTTGRPIFVVISVYTNRQVYVSADAVTWVTLCSVGANPSESGTGFVVPNGFFYKTNGKRTWGELR